MWFAIQHCGQRASGGAAQQDDYSSAIRSGGMEVLYVKTNNNYGFISKSALGASKEFGVKSVSILAGKK